MSHNVDLEAGDWAEKALSTELSTRSINENEKRKFLPPPADGEVAGDGVGQQHTTAAFFHVFWKASAIFTYLFCGWFSDSFILSFVVSVLLHAFDFWTTKNITGRLLVGLRWWNEILDDGTNKWVFESKPNNRNVHPNDSLVFWTGIYLTPIIWCIFGVGAFIGLKFNWLLIVILAISLSGANLVGYWKCQSDASARIQSFISSSVLNAAMNNLAPGSNIPDRR